MKGGFPVGYIVAIVLGVILIALIGYLLIYSKGKGGDAGTEAECIAKKVQYCGTKSESLKTELQTGKCKVDWSKDVCQFCKAIIPNWDKSNTGCS
ncbi:MAG: hypothetical protein HYW24_01475 [Candidatus Aenigmarchaeota archaeon]|nr:hypothetical protein [Candidatus Aenigmarchaeota archaeon]